MKVSLPTYFFIFAILPPVRVSAPVSHRVIFQGSARFLWISTVSSARFTVMSDELAR